MGSAVQGFTSSGGLGLLSAIGTGVSSYYGAQAQGYMGQAQAIAGQAQFTSLQGQAEAQKLQYDAQKIQTDALASKAILEANAMSNQYKIGAINAIMQAEAEKASYDAASAGYLIEKENKKGQAALYDAESAMSLIDKAYTMRNATVLGAVALDAARQGSEAEMRLREEGSKFRGSQRAAIAAGGTDVASGNALDILRETDEGIENDASALRMTAQKNRWQLLVAQQNMWMAAEAKQLESENYKAAAEGLRRSADLSGTAAEMMTQIGDIAMKSGENTAEAQRVLAEMALKSGKITAKGYEAQGAMYTGFGETQHGMGNMYNQLGQMQLQMGNIAMDAANAQAIGGLIGAVAPAATTYFGNRQTGGVATASYKGLTDINDSWDSMSFAMGLDDPIKINESAVGQFLPAKNPLKVDSYGSGFTYSPKKWGIG